MEKTSANPTWSYKSLNELLIACVGTNFGPNPEENLEAIRKDRGNFGRRMIRDLKITDEHTVLDLGSGCGFVTRPVVERAKHVHLADISPSFLGYAQEELAEFKNTSFHIIDYARLPAIEDEALDAAFSTAVFIHFNSYDYVYYLTELWRMLKPGGKLAFDFLNADTIDIRQQRSYVQHLRGYSHNRSTKVFNVVHPMSQTALQNISAQIGFKINDFRYHDNSANTVVFMEKVEMPGALPGLGHLVQQGKTA